MEKLYDLEYKVAKLRASYVSQVEYDELTLKEVAELGFNNVIINGVRLYADSENDIVVYNGNYLKDETILNSKVKFEDFEIVDDELGDYLEIYVKFVDENMNTLLNEVVYFVGDDTDENN